MLGQDFLGEDFLAYLTLALGAALFLGNGLALMKPRVDDDGNLVKAPLGRALIQMAVGGLAAIWSLATILN
jgi:hypothetical protein